MKFLKNQVSYRIPVFDGGLNTKWTDLSCPPHMSPALRHVQFSDVGAVGSAKGWRTHNDTAIASFPIRGLHGLYNSVTENGEVIAVCGGDVYACASGSSAYNIVSGGTGAFDATKDVCIRTVEDEAWMTDGISTPMRYDGSDLHRVNPGTVDNSTYADSETSFDGAASMGAGTYTYLLAGVDSDGQEAVPVTITSDITIAASATTNQIKLTGIPTFAGTAGVDSMYLYRNTAGASNLWYRVTALTASQTAYTDTANDSDISTLYDDSNAAPPTCAFWWYHRGRMFGAGDPDYPMRMYYSKMGSPTSWPATNYVDIGSGDGLPITSIRVVGNSVVVHKSAPDGRRASIWLVYMPDSLDVTDASNWYIIKSQVAYAAAGDKAVAEFVNLQAFLDRNGMFAFNGEQLSGSPATGQVGQYMAESRSENIEPDVESWRASLLSGAAMISHDDKLWLAVPGDGTSLKNDSLYVYDYTVSTKDRGQGAWSKLQPLGIECFANHDGMLLGGSSDADGYVYEMDTGYSLNGSDLDTWFRTVSIAGDDKHWEMTKVWRYLYITVDTPGGWDLNVTWWVDKSATETGSETVNLSGGGAEWGDAEWDADTFDSSTDRATHRINLAGCVGRTIQFEFKTDGTDVPWVLYRLEVEYNLRSRRD